MSNKKINIIWSSGEKDVALKLVFMYAKNAVLKKWWESVHLIVWGPSMKLLSEDLELQSRLAELKQVGVHISACKRCADEYGITEKILQFDIDVKYMGEPLTEILQDNEKIITF
ncbi:DsrE family protein [Desulfovibrio litoralis]|uniref:Uncharacterized protein n=1 Tax=Desulfovibrio litoralis DSM 11393 TaxID=1121455 RepID=A0A1M7SRD5_9BACT|nr:DsrE family protein [Desulfovibrio litoralis]SHN61049.1 hypothetical protein SAMN02745728_01184 [Desulfovibrio litoralis DSM 11393]